MNKFIRSAYEMAMDERANGAAMGFSADGLSLELRDVAVLSARLDKYFNHSKVSSFCRQLNNYGFKKLVPVRSAKGAADGKRLAAAEEAPSLQVFVHPCFQRNRPDLCCQIRRQASGSRTPQPAAAAAAAAATSDDEDDDEEDEDDSAATPSSKPSSNNATIDHLLVLNANLRKHNTDLLREFPFTRALVATHASHRTDPSPARRRVAAQVLHLSWHQHHEEKLGGGGPTYVWRGQRRRPNHRHYRHLHRHHEPSSLYHNGAHY